MTVHSFALNPYRNWSLALITAASLSLLALAAVQISRPTATASSTVVQTANEADLVTRSNHERQAVYLSTLTWDERLYEAARSKAKHMLAQQYFDHVSPTGVTPWSFIRAAGYSYDSAGENLAVGFTKNEQVVQAWMNSPTHRANILDPDFTEIAIAEAHGTLRGEGVTVVVQMFGEPE